MTVSLRSLIFSSNNIDLYHYQHENRIIDISEHKTKVVFISILVAVLTPFLLGIGGYLLTSRLLAAHYKWKKIEILERQEQVLRIDSIANQLLNGQIIPPLEETGGMSNNGNTCYMASVLQTLKSISFFWNYLNETKHPLCQFVDETNERYEKRKQIRQVIIDILQTSMRGETVQAASINHLRELALDYQPGVFSLVDGEDPKDFWFWLCQILDIPQTALLESDESLQVYSNCLSFLPEDFVNFQDKLQQAKLVRPSPIVAFNIDAGWNHLPVHPPSFIEMACEGQDRPMTYELVSLINCAGHAVAHLRDPHHEGEWITFDDDVRGRIGRPSEEDKKNATLIFYRYLPPSSFS